MKTKRQLGNTSDSKSLQERAFQILHAVAITITFAAICAVAIVHAADFAIDIWEKSGLKKSLESALPGDSIPGAVQQSK
jgi:hypothetical protein